MKNYRLTIKGEQFSRLIEAHSIEDALEIALIYGYKKSRIKITPAGEDPGVWAYLNDTIRRPRYVKNGFHQARTVDPKTLSQLPIRYFDTDKKIGKTIKTYNRLLKEARNGNLIVYQGAVASGIRVVEFAKTDLIDGKLVLVGFFDDEILHEDFQSYLEESGLKSLEKAEDINAWEPIYEYAKLS